jgi:peptide deformylase
VIPAFVALAGPHALRPEPLTLVRHPDERLYTRVPAVAEIEFGGSLGTILDAMVATMLAPRADGKPQGVGLAGPQVGFMRRVLVMRADDDATVHRMVNPVITQARGPVVTAREACLSLPGLDVNVGRASAVQVAYQFDDGTKNVLWLDGFEARIVQHEIDHLNGITLLNHARRGARFEYERRFGRAAA